MRKKNGFTIIELMVVSAIILIIVVLFLGGLSGESRRIKKKQEMSKIEDQNNRAAFRGWVKMTGNTNQLSYEEWLQLKNANLLNKNSEGK